MVDHIDNPLMEVRAGAPEIPHPNRSEDEEIEHILQEYIRSHDNTGDDSDDEFADEELDRLINEYADANDGRVDADATDPLRWPTQGETPINEYNTEGYIAMAFPTLFPYGRADFRDHSDRHTRLQIAEYFEALLRYKDGRFGVHPRLVSSEMSTLTSVDLCSLP